MGALESMPEEDVVEQFQEGPTMFENWGPTQINNLHSLYIAENHDFGITCTEFTVLLASAIPEGKVAGHRLIKTFDCEASNMVDVLEVLCGLVVSSETSSIDWKISKIFDLFDFDKTDQITYDELFICMFSCLRSMVRVVGKGIEPEDSDVEKIADEIFLKADREPTLPIKKSEFVGWVHSEVNFGQKKGQLKKITLPQLMLKFDVIEEDDAKDLEQDRLLKIASKPAKVKKKDRKKSHHAGHRKDSKKVEGIVSVSG
ncbi:hypothetical protein TrVE_jg6324 [Triparma verrucosa]|uniref:EF-hand domain-containing protein n=2 Tax=Triparma TaxID=722752 RepID=A0A9W7B2N7_9STRA|nr:hypothetical protein TrST_g2816 [Triparma strigata]GMH97250.1 hypothetical protein TrVE_jg6324 [Triparma verrucosa]